MSRHDKAGRLIRRGVIRIDHTRMVSLRTSRQVKARLRPQTVNTCEGCGAAADKGHLLRSESRWGGLIQQSDHTADHQQNDDIGNLSRAAGNINLKQMERKYQGSAHRHSHLPRTSGPHRKPNQTSIEESLLEERLGVEGNRTVEKTLERHPRKRPCARGKVKWLQRLNDHKNDKQDEYHGLPNRETRKEAEPTDHRDRRAQRLRRRQDRIDDHDPRAQQERDRKREYDVSPCAVEEFVQGQCQDQPDDRVTVQIQRRQFRRHQQRPYRMPILVQVDHGRVREQPVAEPADENQTARLMSSERLENVRAESLVKQQPRPRARGSFLWCWSIHLPAMSRVREHKIARAP